MKPFLTGRRSPPHASLRPATAASGLRRALAPVEEIPDSGPQVEVVKEGDKVVRLIVVCSCGERTEIECLYSGRP